jgi:hypothetical protein
MEHCPYDTNGVLWRARADKKHVLRSEDDASSGVDSEEEDINEDKFNQHYALTVAGGLPLLDTITRSSPPPKRRSPSRATETADDKRRKRRVPDAFAFDEASQQLQPSCPPLVVPALPPPPRCQLC